MTQSVSPLAQRLRAARVSEGLQQAQVAQVLGLTPQAVSAWERGLCEPRIQHLAQLASLYRVDSLWLLAGPGTDPLVPAPLEGTQEERIVPRG